MTKAPSAVAQLPLSTEVVLLHQYLGFLEHDPSNAALLTDAAHAALAARQLDVARRLLDHLAALGPLSPAATNIKGMVALQSQDFADAEAAFAGLIAQGHHDPSLRFNLAWTKAVLADHAGALALLDEGALAVSAEAPPLKIKMLHHLARLDEALAEGDALLKAHPDNAALAGALSVVAMDAGDMARAASYAERGGTSDDARCTQGLIALSQHDGSTAMALFDTVITASTNQPRAWLGRGLGRLAQGDATGAAGDLQRAATQFETHIGSWIAAGWAYFSSHDLAAARRCFETALALDENFAESHGSLAVLDLQAGKIEQARRQTSVALRLDKACFSAALAKSLLADHDDNPLLARKIRERAMAVAIGPNGETIAQAIVAMGLVPGTQPGGLN